MTDKAPRKPYNRREEQDPRNTLDSRDRAFLEYLEKLEEALRLLLEALENRIRRPNESE
jgi:hypothetical protein